MSGTTFFFLYFHPVKVDRSAGSTVTVIKIFKFTAAARFVRFVLPPFQKPGEEKPVYKVELFGCLDEGKRSGNGKKGKDNRREYARTSFARRTFSVTLFTFGLSP